MKRAIHFRDAARADLREIGAYGRQEWGDARSRSYLLAIAKRMQLLADHPEPGPKAGLNPDGLRKFKSDNHLIMYLPGDDAIEIVRVLHHRMDIPDLLGHTEKV